MPAFPKPTFTFNYDVKEEVKALRHYRNNEPGRQIPKKAKNRLLVATWNIANLGVQDRGSKDYQLIAEIISWFDIAALQEVNDNLEGLGGIIEHLPTRYRTLFSDAGGNDERMAFVYDSKKITELEMVGEIAVPVSDHRFIRLPDTKRKFTGFDRNPYVATFRAGSFEFALVSVHLYFGDDNKADQERRSLEAYATSRWGDLRRKDKDAYVRDIIVLGDFNLPKLGPGDLVYTALRRRGLRLPEHTSRVASNLKNDKFYDQIMFFPGETKHEFTGKTGVFDFDMAVFQELWQTRTQKQFEAYVRYYLSDHRPLWAEFKA